MSGSSRIIITTDRLLLRTWTERDKKPFHAINRCPIVREFLPDISGRADSDATIDAGIRHMEAHGFCLYAAEEKHSGRLAGFIGLSVPSFQAPFTPCVDIGWRLGAEYQGKGYASEGALAVKEHAFNTLGMTEIVSFTVPENIRSRRVMEKTGMRRDPREDFNHPALPENHRLSRHVLYRLRRDGNNP